MANNMRFKKVDFLISIIIGELCAWLMIFIGRNLATENPALLNLLPYFKYLPFVFPVFCLFVLFIGRVLSKIIPVVYQIAKFVLVGGFNFLVDMSVLNFLVFATGISAGIIQSGFKAISFLAAVISSYLWNKHWVFKKTATESAAKEFLQFFVVSVIGFLLNISTNYVFVNMINPFFGMPLKTWAQFSALMASAIAMSWNFLGYKFIVFDVKKPTSDVGSEQK